MPRTATEEIGLLKAEVAALKAKAEHIEAMLLKLTARFPDPAAPPKPRQPLPGWPTATGDTGVAYRGEPTAVETVATGESWVKRHPDGSLTIPGQPFGMRYGKDGKPIAPGPHAPQPIGPPLDAQERLTRALVDRIALSFDDRKKEE